MKRTTTVTLNKADARKLHDVAIILDTLQNRMWSTDDLREIANGRLNEFGNDYDRTYLEVRTDE